MWPSTCRAVLTALWAPGQSQVLGPLPQRLTRIIIGWRSVVFRMWFSLNVSQSQFKPCCPTGLQRRFFTGFSREKERSPVQLVPVMHINTQWRFNIREYRFEIVGKYFSVQIWVQNNKIKSVKNYGKVLGWSKKYL